jgi:hypothetical protein
MKEHGRCRRAVWDTMSHTFQCQSCGETIASGSPNVFGLRRGLRLRPKDHGDFAAYGPGDRARTHPGKSLRGGSHDAFSAVGTIQEEVYVYCPREGCGAGQHVWPTALVRVRVVF